ncbi:MAG: S-methyl-5'-thioadenosine phosphorylase [Thermomicrobiales bacterium]
MILGVIGGSGLYKLPDLDVKEQVTLETPYGKPSDRLTVGRLGAVDVVFLPRHGAAHQLAPTDLPYRANVYALKELGVTHLLSVSAVGSLKEELPPLTIVLPDQFIDRTVSRERSFFDDGVVAHVGIADPICHVFRQFVQHAASTIDHAVVNGGTYVCIEGPQFSTRAESNLYRSWGASVIGMTGMPEARLAREAEICYATLAMVTDYDVWHQSEAAVTVELVIANLNANTKVGRGIVHAIATAGLPERHCDCADALKDAIITSPDHITSAMKRRLGVIAERYLGNGA